MYVIIYIERDIDTCICVYIHIHIYTHTYKHTIYTLYIYIYTFVYIYIYIERERETEIHAYMKAGSFRASRSCFSGTRTHCSAGTTCLTLLVQRRFSSEVANHADNEISRVRQVMQKTNDSRGRGRHPRRVALVGSHRGVCQPGDRVI